MILSSVHVVDLWWLARRWFFWYEELWIDDPFVRPISWLVVTPRVRFLYYIWNYCSIILWSVHVVDFWSIAKGDFLLTFEIKDRWSYHPSTSFTCGDSPENDPLGMRNCGSMILSSVHVVDLWWIDEGNFPLTFGIIDRWSYHPSKSLTCYQSPRGIFSDFCNYGSMILSSVQAVDSWWLARRWSSWYEELWIDDPFVRPRRWLVVTPRVG